MSNPKTLRQASPTIAKLLTRIRRRIRNMVIGEGLAITIATLLLAFWLSLAFDFIPVRFGYAEIPVWGRAVLLLVSLAAAGYFFYRLIWSRLTVPLKDSSMAMLVEKKYRQFNDSLLTTVGRFSHPESQDATSAQVNQDMLTATTAKAESYVDQVELERVVSHRSFLIAGLVAAALIVASGVFVLAAPAMAKLAFDRLYLLDEQKWPRQTEIELAGVSIKRERVDQGIPELTAVLQPVDGWITVAKGSSLAITVNAQEFTDGQEHRKLKIPETCWLNYRSADGSRGSQPFARVGSPRGGQQRFVLDGPPLENVTGDLTIYVFGGDASIGPLHIRAVQRPTVVQTQLHLQFPDYMVAPESTAFMPQTENWTGRKVVPVGTQVRIKSESTSNLSKVYVRCTALPTDDTANPDDTPPLEVLSPQENSFEYEIAAIDQATAIEFFLCDGDGVVNETPHVITIDVIEDQPPEIAAQLAGIGTVVTPDVEIPLQIKLSDDYGLNDTWIEIEIGENVPLTEKLNPAGSELETSIDFRSRRNQVGEQFRLPIESDSRLTLTVKADDKFDLQGAEPNVGSSDQFELTIVTPDELLRVLEQAEVGQRRRLEQIIREINDQREYLLRTQSGLSNNLVDTEPGDREPGDGENSASDDPSRAELRRLFAQRALLQNDKSQQEVVRCADAFADFRLQLINNRVTAQARLKRFEDQVIAPLNETAQKTMNQLDGWLEQLQQQLREIEQSVGQPEINLVAQRQAAKRLAVDSIKGTDQVLVELNAVLDLLIKHETQNELLEIVRQMIQQQQELRDRTKKIRQKKAFEGLLD